MKPQFNHQLISSFFLWFDNHLVSDALSAYATEQYNEFQYIDQSDIPDGFVSYQGRLRQLVAEHNISVPNSGFFVNDQFISGDSADTYVDYNNGRIILPSASGIDLDIYAHQSVKEFNLYLTEDDEEQLLFQNDFVSQDNINTTHFTEHNSNNEKLFLLPACFIRLETSENNAFCLGGEMDTRNNIRIVVLGFDNYSVDGILSYFLDKKHDCITLVPFEDYPYEHFSDVKDYPYEYKNFIKQYNKKMFVQDVKTSKMTRSLSLEKIQSDVIMGFIDFNLSTHRYPV